MGTITMVMPDEDRWFYSELGSGAQARAEQTGHRVAICRVSADEGSGMQAADCIEAAFADEDSLGAVAAGFPYRGHGGERFLAWRKPLVIVGGSVLGFPVVSFDDVGVGRTATKHLLDLGHVRVAHLTGSLAPNGGFVAARRRAKGYRSTMESAGLLAETVESELGGPALVSAVETLLGRAAPPTAIFAAADEMAFVVIDVATRMGLQIGRDLSVVGVGDHPDAARLGLTTLRTQPAEVGAVAVQMILDGLDAGPGAAKSRIQPSSLVRRPSTSRLQDRAA